MLRALYFEASQHAPPALELTHMFTALLGVTFDPTMLASFSRKKNHFHS